MAFALGQSVVVDGIRGHVIEKLLKHTAVVERNGRKKTVPLSMVEPDDGPALPVEKTEPAKEVQTEQQSLPLDAEEKPASKRRSKKEAAPAPAAAAAAPASDDKDEGPVTHETAAKKEKPVKKITSGKDVCAFMSGIDNFNDLEKAVRAHKLFPSINKEAFKRAVEQKKTVGYGLLRMRIGNMLRAAERRV
jgi:hypothetical protein